MCSLLFRSVTNSCSQADDGRLVLFLLSYSNCVGNRIQVAIDKSVKNEHEKKKRTNNEPVTVVYVEYLPTVGKETLLDILGECNGGVTIDGDVCRKFLRGLRMSP